MRALILNKCNTHDDCELPILKVFSTRKKDDLYQAVIQLDRASYEAVINSGHIFAGYDSCRVYDAVDVQRCFKCKSLVTPAQNVRVILYLIF